MLHISKEDIYPPPQIPDAVPPTVRTLSRMLEDAEDKHDLLFARGCVHLRGDRPEDAVRDFEELARLCPESAEGRCNLAVAYVLTGRADEAARELKQAILLDSSLALPHHHLAALKQLQGETQAAIELLQKALQLAPEDASSRVALAELLDEQGEEGRALEQYEQALAVDPELFEARNRLGGVIFARGRGLFEQEKYDEAFAAWYQGYSSYEQAFFAEKSIAQSRRELVRQFNAAGLVKQAVKEYTKGRTGKEDLAELSYRLFTRFFFSVGLIPEVYCPREGLEAEAARWRQGHSEEGVIPFPHFRLGVVYCYQGRLEEAHEELSFCRDHLPQSKQRPLKLEQILRFVKDLSDIKVDEQGVRVSSASQDEWSAAGFNDPFQLQAWKKTGLGPAEAVRWRASGLSPATAADWAHFEFEPEQALQWFEAGVRNADAARRWIRAEFSLEEALSWVQHFSDKPELAIQSRRAGFAEPEEAAAWMKIFMFPGDAWRWKELGFIPRDAAVFVAEGVRDPVAARRQQQAARQQALERQADLKEEDK